MRVKTGSHTFIDGSIGVGKGGGGGVVDNIILPDTSNIRSNNLSEVRTDIIGNI